MIFFYFIFLVEILNALIYWCMLMDQSSLLILALQRLAHHRIVVLYFFSLIPMPLFSSKTSNSFNLFCMWQFLISGFIQHACRLPSWMMSNLSRVLHSGWLLRYVLICLLSISRNLDNLNMYAILQITRAACELVW